MSFPQAPGGVVPRVVPDEPFLVHPWEPEPFEPPPLPRPTLRSAWRNVLFFALTVLSVYMIGGLRLTVGLLGILMAHEMGHYVACRIYRVDATLPFFIPSPWFPVGIGWIPLSFVGTFGAVIRIKDRIPHRRALFDIGIAGPLAGFVVMLPVLWLGVQEASWMRLPPPGEGISFGEPLLFQWAVRALRGSTPEGMTLGIGPLGVAAWFGMFVTALNLIPVGQLDGGHVVHALLPRWSRTVSRLGFAVCLLLLWHTPGWILWTILLFALGRQPHPPTRNDRLPVGRGRVVVGVIGLLVLVVCFTPSPVEFTWPEFAQAIGELVDAVTSH